MKNFKKQIKMKNFKKQIKMKNFKKQIKMKKYNLLCVCACFFYDTFDKCGKISREIYV